MEEKHYTTGEFAKKVGVTTKTVQRWDKTGKLKPSRRTPSNRRQYSQDQVDKFGKKNLKEE